MAQLEDEKGISGFRDTEAKLEAVSSVKSEIDQRKGETLEDMSRVVETMKKTIKANKASLQPRLVEFKALRSRVAQVEEEYTRKKKAYEALVMTHQAETDKLQTDVDGNKLAIAEDESKFHLLTNMFQLFKARVEDMLGDGALGDKKESKGKEAGDGNWKAYLTKYEQSIAEHEKASKVLREEKKLVADSHGESVNQRQMFLQLSRLLKCKAKVQKEGGAGGAGLGGSGPLNGLGDQPAWAKGSVDEMADRLTFD